MNRPHTLVAVSTITKEGLIKTHLAEGLLDTGADISAVSLDIINEIGAYKTNKKTKVFGNIGNTICDIYEIYIDVGLGNPAIMEVVGLDRNNSKYKILLGVDYIYNIIFHLDKGTLFLDK